MGYYGKAGTDIMRSEQDSGFAEKIRGLVHTPKCPEAS